MGYMIQYGNLTRQEKILERKKAKIHKMVAVFILLLAILLRVLVPQSAKWIRNILVPGMTEEAAAAFSEMMIEIYQGEPASDAWEAFCEDVVANAYEG